jgi:hypothetical protein
VILSVEPTPARFRQETLAARRMLERVSHFGVRPLNLAAVRDVSKKSYVLRSLPQAVCSLAGASATSDPRIGRYASLQALATRSLQGRSAVRRTEAADKTAPRTIATIMECDGGVPPRSHGPKSEKVGAAPGSKAIARTQHDLTASETTRSGSRRFKFRKGIKSAGRHALHKN